jgi:hypothetical protein
MLSLASLRAKRERLMRRTAELQEASVGAGADADAADMEAAPQRRRLLEDAAGVAERMRQEGCVLAEAGRFHAAIGRWHQALQVWLAGWLAARRCCA